MKSKPHGDALRIAIKLILAVTFPVWVIPYMIFDQIMSAVDLVYNDWFER